MKLFRIAVAASIAGGALACVGAGGQGGSNLADNPDFYKKDPNETVITDIAGWSHPAKAVFEKYHLTLTKVELLWNRKFPVFHVSDFGADPGAGPAASFFTSLEMDLLKANGGNAFKIVEDNAHDGFVVAYDRQQRRIAREMVQEESP